MATNRPLLAQLWDGAVHERNFGAKANALSSGYCTIVMLETLLTFRVFLGTNGMTSG